MQRQWSPWLDYMATKTNHTHTHPHTHTHIPIKSSTQTMAVVVQQLHVQQLLYNTIVIIICIVMIDHTAAPSMRKANTHILKKAYRPFNMVTGHNKARDSPGLTVVTISLMNMTSKLQLKVTSQVTVEPSYSWGRAGRSRTTPLINLRQLSPNLKPCIQPRHWLCSSVSVTYPCLCLSDDKLLTHTTNHL